MKTIPVSEEKELPLHRFAWKHVLPISMLPLGLHLWAGGNYGIFRDELYYLACARRLAWGYVDHPPFSVAVLGAWIGVFGDSPEAIRMLPALLNLIAVVLTSMIAWQMGGGPSAQRIGALATAVAPLLLGITGFYSMNAFELIFWTTLFLLVVLLARTDRPGLWLAVGVMAGIALLNKLSILVWGVALIGGLVLTPYRREFARWPIWAGGLIAVSIFLPHVLWQAAHAWPTLEFLNNAANHKNLHHSLPGFLGGLITELHPLNAPIWTAGIIWLLVAPTAQRFRPIGIMAVIIFVIFYLQGGKLYYIAPLAPTLFAAGSIAFERSTVRFRLRWAEPALAALLFLGGGLTAPLAIPLLSPVNLIAYQQHLGLRAVQEERNDMGELDQHFADQFGWKAMAGSVMEVVRQLPQEERRHLVVLTRNYGEAGALEYFGRNTGMPRVASGHNNYARWDSGDPPKTVVAIGISRKVLQRHFGDIRVEGIHDAQWAMPDERHLEIFVCRDLQRPFEEIRKELRTFI